MFRLLKAIFRLNIEEYIQYNAIKLKKTNLRKVWIDKSCKYIKLINYKFYVLVTVHHERRVKGEKPTRCN